MVHRACRMEEKVHVPGLPGLSGTLAITAFNAVLEIIPC